MIMICDNKVRHPKLKTVSMVHSFSKTAEVMQV